MAILLMVLIVLHVVPGVFWAGSTFALARDPMMGDARLGTAQIGAAAVTILVGIALWAINHAYAPGPQEWTLGVGAICAIVAAGVQRGVAWPARKRSAQGEGAQAANLRRAAIGQRAAALLLIVAVSAMVTWRYM